MAWRNTASDTAAYNRDLAAAVAAALAVRQDTSGDRFAFLIGSFTHIKRAKTADDLAAILWGLRNDPNSGCYGESNSTPWQPAGQLAGFTVSARVVRFLKHTSAEVRLDDCPRSLASSESGVFTSTAAFGLITKLENAARRLENVGEEAERGVARAEREVEQAATRVDAPSAKAGELATARDRQAAVESEMARLARGPQPADAVAA